MKLINTYVPVHASMSENNYLMAVLTNGHGYAVYIGIVQLPPPDSPDYDHQRADAAEYVMANGTKQSYAHALAYFPNIHKSEYRA